MLNKIYCIKKTSLNRLGFHFNGWMMGFPSDILLSSVGPSNIKASIISQLVFFALFQFSSKFELKAQKKPRLSTKL